MKQVKKFKNQSGFAMLEVVLAIVIIAIASFGVYTLYKSSSTNSNLSNEESLVSQIYNASNQMAAQNGTQPTAKELFDSGMFSTKVYPSNNGVFPAAFGNATYSSQGSYATIVLDKIPGSVVNQLASHMMDWGNVYIGSTEYDGSQKFTPSDEYEVTLYYPRGAKAASGD